MTSNITTAVRSGRGSGGGPGDPAQGSQASVTRVLSVPHQVTRLVSGARQPYEEFGGRYQAVAPALDP